MSNEESEDKNSIKNESDKKESEKNESVKNESDKNESEENNNEKNKKNKKDKYKNEEEDDEYKSEDDDDFNFSEEEKKHKKKKLGNKRKREIKKKKNKKEKTGRNFFLEGEAEENEEEDSYGSGEITKEQQEKIYKRYDETHFNKKNKQLKITDDNEEEIVKRYDQKEQELEEEEEDYYENMYKRPKMDDPKLWLVKCKIGEEKEIVSNLYHKYFYYKSKEPKDRLKIFSIISYDNLKGKIFIEAFSQKDVIHAISGMSNVNPNSVQIIPVDECTKIFEFDKFHKININNNQLVRIKHGNYEGDLAKVVYIEDPINKIYIALIPRINEFSKNEKSKNDNSKNKNGFNVAPFSKQRSTIRPRQKLFDEKKNYGVEVITTHEIFGECKLCGKNKFKDGLLIKAVRISSLEIENICPKEEELQKLGCYKENGIYKDKNNEHILTVSNTISKNIKYKPGSSIRFISGEYKGITGTIISQVGDKINVKLDLKDFNDVYQFQSDMVTINFKPGEIVYVKSGINKGKNGMVIKYIEDNNYAIYDEITQTKFIAKNTDLILSSEMKFNNEENSIFKIGDLVRIKNSNIICYIIESTKFILKVVTSRNEIKKVSAREIEKINLNKKATYVDSKQNPITHDNVVKVINGPYKGNKGTIKCIFRKYVFLHNNNFNRTNGIFCEINDNLEILGSELLIENSEKGKVNVKRVPNEIKDLLGKTVHVIEGNWKGYNGILIDANDKFIKLELSAKQKTIQLPFTYIKEGDVNSAKDTEGISLTPTLSMKTPAYYIESHKI